nr:hypothetical protein [Tanacetum cinerariifolium]
MNIMPCGRDSYEVPANAATTGKASNGTGKKKGRTVTLTADDMQKRKNDVKARTTPLLSLPNEHQLRFNVAGFDKSKVECFNYHKMSHFAREGRAPRSQDRGRRDNYKQGSKVKEEALKALMEINRVGWDWRYMANDEENHALVADEEAPTEFALMAKTSAESKVFDSSLCSNACKKNTNSLNSKITELTDKLFDAKNMNYHYKLALAQKEKEGLDSKLAGFQTASKDLDSLLESQRLDKNKEGLGYSDVPPPPAQVYSPPKKDLSWTGLPEFKDDTVTDYSRPLPVIESTSDDAQNRTPSEASPSTISPKSFIKFVKANDSLTKSKTDKVKIAKKPPVNGANSTASGNYSSRGTSSGNGTTASGNISFPC